MSRVHDALRKAAQQEKPEISRPTARAEMLSKFTEAPAEANGVPEAPPIAIPPASGTFSPHSEDRITAPIVDVEADIDDLDAFIVNAPLVPYTPAKEALLVSPSNPREAPAEEFRTIRTRLNHLQTLQPLHTLVVTSASPAEGKSFTAMNLAVSQSQLADKRVLLADFDFRRPTVDKNFQVPSSPGITDYLLGKAGLSEIIRKIEGTNLYLMTAGESVPNPLELLNLKECKALIQGLRNHFDWVILDSPPLLFAADGNLLATMCDGTILVVRIGTTTFDSVTRALQSLCENNVLGVVVNGARRGELYSKYTYYHDYYYAPESAESQVSEGAEEQEEAPVES
ncbi:MAG: CpsD/CapB family tyrosine-protein kinase [Acidobacteriaceae bacterium]|nr:CpsD/CapB family tyrosine-protein kinase [Acidobacteriaceae bacterium]